MTKSTLKKQVLVVAFPGCQILDIAGPVSVLEGANRVLPGPMGYAVSIVGSERSATPTSGCITIEAEGALDEDMLSDVDMLIIPGGKPGTQRAMRNKELIAFIQAADRLGKTIVSICTGSFLLGQAGLLKNRRCTTHWGDLDAFKALFPDARLCEDSIYTQDGNIWTSAGVTTGIDLTLAIVEQDFSASISQQIACNLVLMAARPANHRQNSELLNIPAGLRQSLKDVLLYVRANPQEDHCLNSLAERANMSVRNFSRRFQCEFGMSPAQMIRKIRSDRARELFQTTDYSAKQVARFAGFASVNSMRRNLNRASG